MKLYIKTNSDLKKGKFYFDSKDVEEYSRIGSQITQLVTFNYIYDTAAQIKYAAEQDEADWTEDDVINYLDSAIDLYSIYELWRTDLYNKIKELPDDVYAVQSLLRIYGGSDNAFILRTNVARPGTGPKKIIKSPWSNISLDDILNKVKYCLRIVQPDTHKQYRPNKAQTKLIVNQILDYFGE